MARVVFAVALLAGVLACAAATRPLQRSAVDDGDITHQLKFINKHVDKKDKHPYRTPTGLFIQVRCAAMRAESDSLLPTLEATPASGFCHSCKFTRANYEDLRTRFGWCAHALACYARTATTWPCDMPPGTSLRCKPTCSISWLKRSLCHHGSTLQSHP